MASAEDWRRASLCQEGRTKEQRILQNVQKSDLNEQSTLEQKASLQFWLQPQLWAPCKSPATLPSSVGQGGYGQQAWEEEEETGRERRKRRGDSAKQRAVSGPGESGDSLLGNGGD